MRVLEPHVAREDGNSLATAWADRERFLIMRGREVGGRARTRRAGAGISITCYRHDAKVRRVEHHAALPWRQMGAFMAELRSTGRHRRAGVGVCDPDCGAHRRGDRRPLGRTRWRRVDGSGGADEGRPRAPGAAVACRCGRGDGDGPARGLAGGFVFPGGKKDKPLSSMALLMLLRRMGRGDLTAHGFRSTFRQWAAEATGYPREVVETGAGAREQGQGRGRLPAR